MSGSEEEDEVNLTPRVRKRTKKEDSVPVWQKTKELVR